MIKQDKLQLQEMENLLCDLIRIEGHQDTLDQEKKVVDFLFEYLIKHGISAMKTRVTGKRCNLIARINGNGKGPTLLFNAHTDTVPVCWMKDPFKPRTVNGRIFGRGSVDVKGALAAMTCVLVNIRQSKIKLAGDLILAATIGEETNSPGAYALAKSGIKADYAIIGEPTGMEIGIAHKGVLWLEAMFKGKSAHGSVPEKGINAIYNANKWIEAIRKEYIPHIKRIKHPVLGFPSINIGMINGGTRPVIVPEFCKINFERRMLPGENEKEIIKELQNIIEGIRKKDPDMNGHVSSMNTFNGIPHGPFESESKNPLVDILLDGYKKEFHFDTKPRGLQYWTDAALLSGIPGIKAVVCGPGNIEQAHSTDEYVTRGQLHAAYRIYHHTALNIGKTI